MISPNSFLTNSSGVSSSISRSVYDETLNWMEQKLDDLVKLIEKQRHVHTKPQTSWDYQSKDIFSDRETSRHINKWESVLQNKTVSVKKKSKKKKVEKLVDKKGLI